MSNPCVADPQLEILQHSLGLDRYGQGNAYRNHFVTSPGSTDWPHCQALVDAGLMRVFEPNALTGGGHCFAVTEAGIAHVKANSPKPPKTTAGQRRYRSFLRYDSGLTFGDWLKSGGERQDYPSDRGGMR